MTIKTAPIKNAYYSNDWDRSNITVDVETGDVYFNTYNEGKCEGFKAHYKVSEEGKVKVISDDSSCPVPATAIIWDAAGYAFFYGQEEQCEIPLEDFARAINDLYDEEVKFQKEAAEAEG